MFAIVAASDANAEAQDIGLRRVEIRPVFGLAVSGHQADWRVAGVVRIV